MEGGFKIRKDVGYNDMWGRGSIRANTSTAMFPEVLEGGTKEHMPEGRLSWVCFGEEKSLDDVWLASAENEV